MKKMKVKMKTSKPLEVNSRDLDLIRNKINQLYAKIELAIKTRRREMAEDEWQYEYINCKALVNQITDVLDGIEKQNNK